MHLQRVQCLIMFYEIAEMVFQESYGEEISRRISMDHKNPRTNTKYSFEKRIFARSLKTISANKTENGKNISPILLN